ncbi:DUF3313 domain-containing protein [Erwinia sp. MMLR14_017]|uniref:DUF3313 domain-containing protein n=1 Tax=Erwinia sp. MMLR14_017 TaxID=3093842 RepID=UPI00298F98EF|nr:DUF3313 domain-containing protein [Erwinia sp. MMLR14_017]MDW8846395.1 DUF3313 domain-containing protein [Erwinia sp. MMLR14_017]
MHVLRLCLITGLVVTSLTGCSSKVAETQQYSGFLSDYSRLRAMESPGGHQTLRWISPDFHSADYHGIYYKPVVYYPAAKPTARVSQSTLDNLKNYVDSRFKVAVAKHKPLINTTGQGTLIMKTAITSVSAENQDMKFYEVVPVAAVIASTMAASGHRTQNSVLYLETQLSDAKTGKVMLEAVRKAYGKTVPNNSAPITLEDLKQGADEMINDVVAFPPQP